MFLLELFMFGTFWFWLLCVGASIAIISFLEYDRAIAAGVVTIATIAAIIGLGNTGVLAWIVANPFWIASGVVGFFLIAIIWAFCKWTFYVHNIKDFIQEKKAEFIRGLRNAAKYNHNNLTEEQKANYINSADQGILIGEAIPAWEEYVKNWEEHRERDRITKPLRIPATKQEVIAFVEENKSRVIGWMTFWPWSMVWTLLNDPIRKIMKHIFIQLKTWFVKIAMKAFGVQEQKQ